MTAMGAGPALRLARTAVFAAVCVLVSGLGHALSSGGPLPPRVLALAFVPVCVAGWSLSGKERGGGVIVGASAAGQLLLHAVFSGLHPGPRGGHAGHGSHRDSGTGLLEGAGLTSGMLGAHLLAGLVCGWWLWRGDRAFVQLVCVLRLFVYDVRDVYERFRFAHAVLGGGRRAAYQPLLAAPVAYQPVRPPAQLPAPHVVSRRGPPLLAF